MELRKKLGMALCPLLLVAAACSSNGKKSESAMQKDSIDASKQVSNATEVIHKMEADPKMQGLMKNARGIFIVPRYGQAALGIGGSGGEGVLVVKRGSSWSDPAFYNVGGVSIGLQAGAQGGSLAFILNNDNAVQQFKKSNNVQLSANAGLTVVNWSRATQAELSNADVVAWSDSKGLFGGLAVGLQDVRFDQDDSSAYYERTVTLDEFFTGNLKAPQGKSSSLKDALSAGSSRLSGGSNSSGSSSNTNK